MTAEERAEAFWKTPAPDKYERRPIELLAQTIREAEQAAAAQARAEEREACAKIADDAMPTAQQEDTSEQIAAAIRARSTD